MTNTRLFPKTIDDTIIAHNRLAVCIRIETAIKAGTRAKNVGKDGIGDDDWPKA